MVAEDPVARSLVGCLGASRAEGAGATVTVRVPIQALSDAAGDFPVVKVALPAMLRCNKSTKGHRKVCHAMRVLPGYRTRLHQSKILADESI